MSQAHELPARITVPNQSITREYLMEGAEQQGNNDDHISIAYYVTGHGYGHATRVVEVCKSLQKYPCTIHIVTAAPDFIFLRELDEHKVRIRPVLLDCGAAQSDALTVNRELSLRKYKETAMDSRDQIIDQEVAWMKETNVQVVVSDIVPIACAAGKSAGLPVICCTNFSWDFVYSEYLVQYGQLYPSIVQQIADDYAKADLLLRLPGYVPMPAFRRVQDVPLVVRMAVRSREEVLNELGIDLEAKVMLFNFGGQSADWTLREDMLPPGWVGLVCTMLPVGAIIPPNFIRPDRDAYVPDLINAADVLLGKIGYGTASEALAHRKPFIFIRRNYFNEEPFLRKELETNSVCLEMTRGDFFSGNWQSYLELAVKMPMPEWDGEPNGGQVVANTIWEVASGKRTFDDGDGALSTQLKDAVLFGYFMKRARDDLGIPDWYQDAMMRNQAPESPRTRAARELRGSSENIAESYEQTGIELLHTSSCMQQDVLSMVNLLKKAADGVITSTPEAHVSASELAAVPGLFEWEKPVVVSRAPGRLDVLGGIADYSGSMVLQMPIAEAAVVALQLAPGVDSIQVVSFGADLSNRQQMFQMKVSDLLTAQGEPKPYAAVRSIFSEDHGISWAAYIVGCLVVLLHEKLTSSTDIQGMSVLVHSHVPEGKGVSSSAAVEVSTMMALTAALGIEMEGRQLALLCQKVENHVVGAPCGVMDQMASALGQKDKLLALLCRPAEVLGFVEIPGSIKLWGVDSGIKHSVGGSDYSSVRTAAFMGKAMLKQLGNETVKHQLQECDFLTAIPESQIGEMDKLPQSMSGEEFLERFSDHEDGATTVQPSSSYAVQQCVRHPIEENHRVRVFARMLKLLSVQHACNMTSEEEDETMKLLGELMLQSHESYSRCGLGAEGTNNIVAHSQVHPEDLFGAKITGGGSGGTVCVLARATADAALYSVVDTYAEHSGHRPYVFEGSSPGAVEFGHLSVRFCQGK